MASFIITGDLKSRDEYINRYIQDNNFLPYEIERFDEIFKIEDSRKLKKSLSYKVSRKKLIILSCELTTEAQNALLKSIEESDDEITFLVSVSSRENVLSTILSRCFVVNVGQEKQSAKPLFDVLGNGWEFVDKFYKELDENQDLTPLLRNLRHSLLDNLNNKDNVFKNYNRCKLLIELMPLMQTNNVQTKIILEKIFLP